MAQVLLAGQMPFLTPNRLTALNKTQKHRLQPAKVTHQPHPFFIYQETALLILPQINIKNSLSNKNKNNFSLYPRSLMPVQQ